MTWWLSHIHVFRIFFFSDLHALNFIIFSKGKRKTGGFEKWHFFNPLIARWHGWDSIFMVTMVPRKNPMYAHFICISSEHMICFCFCIWRIFFCNCWNKVVAYQTPLRVRNVERTQLRRCYVTDQFFGWLHSNNGPFIMGLP